MLKKAGVIVASLTIVLAIVIFFAYKAAIAPKKPKPSKQESVVTSIVPNKGVSSAEPVIPEPEHESMSEPVIPVSEPVPMVSSSPVKIEAEVKPEVKPEVIKRVPESVLAKEAYNVLEVRGLIKSKSICMVGSQLFYGIEIDLGIETIMHFVVKGTYDRLEVGSRLDVVADCYKTSTETLILVTDLRIVEGDS